MSRFTHIFPPGLIVSCQARPDEPLFGSDIMVRMAKAASQGGAVAVRANSPPDVKAIKATVSLPLIGIYKKRVEEFDVYITPDYDSASEIINAGADAVALDATARPRPGNQTLSQLVKRLRKNFHTLLMADISTPEEALAAEHLGFDAVATTLSGYTPYSRQIEEPDLELVQSLATRLDIPVIAEGRYHYPEQAAEAIRRGAYAVVVGQAITRPQQITQRFVEALKRIADEKEL